MNLREWIDVYQLQVRQNGNEYFIGNRVFLHVHHQNGLILNKDVSLKLPKNVDKYDHYLFQFGTNWYFTNDGKFVPFKYIGKAKINLEPIPYLGIHGGFELCNGSVEYKDWVNKAKFLNIKTLAICEKHTLAGVLDFQAACEKADIKPILGETLNVLDGNSENQVKVYVRTSKGWSNLLLINKIINVDNGGKYIEVEDLLKHADGLACVFSSDYKLTPSIQEVYKKAFGDVFYQMDLVEYKSDSKDKDHLEIVKYNFRNIDIPCVLINDSYYLEKHEGYIKKKLNEIGKLFSYQSEDQYFKSIDQCCLQYDGLVKDGVERFVEMMRNTVALAEMCNYIVPIKKEFFLPDYEMTSRQMEEYGVKNNYELFWALISNGMEENGFGEKYVDRIEKEFKVIQKGGYVGYFLIWWDMCKWCRDNGILYGPGRGSVGGSLLAYLLNITSVDPIKYGLLFERFLNEGRIGKSLPDVDLDFPTNRRSEVQQYIKDRYGRDQVCNIGTYSTFKVKQALHDLGRLQHHSPATLDFISKMIEEDGSDWWSIFKDCDKKALKDFVLKNHDLITDIKLIINQPKAASIHAAGMVIVPKGKKIWEYMPIKSMDGNLVSEWKGTALEDAGFLKEDILGLDELDKIHAINKLIVQNGKEIKTWEQYDYNDKRVYKLFKGGYNQDVFQFNGFGMITYSRSLKPDNFEELTAMTSLYRTGPMDSNAHLDYVNLKYGHSKPMYDYGLRSVTEETGGLYIYQEQIMKAVQVLGGFSLNEADDIRKAMGKKIKSIMDENKVKFIKGALERKCPQAEAEKIWNKLEVFSGYGFNKSHATAYSMIGFVSQYLKLYHPLEFWTVSLQEAKNDKVHLYLSELHQLNNSITVEPPDINHSYTNFKMDYDSRSIYWSMSRIKNIGDSTVNVIVQERSDCGDFKSLDDAFERLPKNKVNKRTMYHLILSGCFDKVEGIKEPFERYTIIKKWCKLTNSEMPIKGIPNISKNYFWVWQQKELSGLGTFDFKGIMAENLVNKTYGKLIEDRQIFLAETLDRKIVVAGILKSIVKRTSKRGDFVILNLEGNGVLFSVIFWNDKWTQFKTQINESENSIVILSGLVVEDKYRGGHVVQSHRDSIFKKV